jgi:hypothetical protein
MLESVLKGQKLLKLTHSIISVERIDFETRSLELVGEYHVRLSSAEPSPGGVPGNQKALGLSFLLPEGKRIDISNVSVNNQVIDSPEDMDDNLLGTEHQSPSYWLFPESACTESMAAIFSRICENRRDLISYEEIGKAHVSASLAQSFGLLVRVPSQCLGTSASLSIVVRMKITESPLFKVFHSKQVLATLGKPEIWFPLPSRLMLLPSGFPVTAQPMEHQRHRITIKFHESLSFLKILASGDHIHPHVFESSWLNPRSAGIFVGLSLVGEDKSVYQAFGLEEDFLSPLVVSEIVQVLAPWFASPAQLLPQLNLVLLPLPDPKIFFVFGNTLVLNAGDLAVNQDLNPHAYKAFLAEAVATLWIERSMPSFAEPWIPVGIATMLADRFVEFHLGINEYQHRILQRRQRFHYLVERGMDWRPLTVIPEATDPIVQLKAPLVIECLRRAIAGDSDLRTAFHELATIAGGKKGPWTSEMFLFLVTCTVGQHTEAGKAIPDFKEFWVKSVGVPVIHVGFSFLEKRRFSVNVSQRPLQKCLVHDFVPLCTAASSGSTGTQTATCSCGQDFVCRTSSEGSFMRAHHQWPSTMKRRYWPGDIQVAVFRASNYFVPVTVSMTKDSPDSASTVVTVPSVTPRKHELHLNRAHREDELVHGFLTAMEDKWWLLSKIVVCQSPLMWCNQLAFSRNALMEHAAIEALQHVRGSALVQEALVNTVTCKETMYFWRTRIEAGRALVHMTIGCGEREALHSLVAWMDSLLGSPNRKLHALPVSDILTWIGIGEYLAVMKRSTDRRDHPLVQKMFVQCMRSLERAIALHPKESEWRNGNPSVLLAAAIKFSLQTVSEENHASVFREIDARLRSDRYGAPLASTGLVVTESVLGACVGNPSTVGSMWPSLLDPENLEQLACSAQRRVSRIAVRALINGKGDSVEGWLVRILWIEHLTNQLGSDDMQTAGWIIDSWEFLLERAKKDLGSPKSALNTLLHKREICDMLWKYLTFSALKLPPCIRTSVVLSVHSLYLHAYGTGVPGPYKDTLDQVREGRGPLSFWLPLKEHERAYRRFVYRGPTVRPEVPAQVPKKPKLLITSAGSVPLVAP